MSFKISTTIEADNAADYAAAKVVLGSASSITVPPPPGGTVTPPPPSGGDIAPPPPPPTGSGYTMGPDGQKYFTADFGNLVGTSADTNAWPITLTDPAAKSIDVGVGPNVVRIAVISDPSRDADFGIKIGDTVVLAPVHCSARVSTDPQVITIRGPFGKYPMVSFFALPPLEYNGTNFLSVSCDFNPLYYSSSNKGYGSNSSKDTPSFNALSTWNSNNNAEAFGPKIYIPAPVDGGVTATLINGKTLSDWLATAADGSTFTLDAGVIVGNGEPKAKMTLVGAGRGKTIIDGFGEDTAGSKGLITPHADFAFKGLTFRNAATPNGGNGCAVRQYGDGINLTGDDFEAYGCEDGFLTFAGVLNFSNFDVHNNGKGDGSTHNFYLSGADQTALDNAVANLTDGKIHDANVGHEYKSRYGTNNLTRVDITCQDGACIEMPVGGNITVVGGSSNVTATTGDRRFLAVGAEAADVQRPGVTFHYKDHVFNNQNASDAKLECYQDAKYNLILENCTWKGKPPVISGNWASVTGSVTPAP